MPLDDLYESPWYIDTIANEPPLMGECSITLRYVAPPDEEDASDYLARYLGDYGEMTSTEWADLVYGTTVSIVSGQLMVWFVTDTSAGFADFAVTINPGTHTLGPDTMTEYGPGDTGTLQEYFDALENETSWPLEIAFDARATTEFSWFTHLGETYWFGSDPEWYTNDPTCGATPVDEEPAPPTQPTAPVIVDTAARG